MRQEVMQKMSSFRMPADNADLKLLEDEHKRDIDAMLTPEEKREYDLRNSDTARQLQYAFSDFDGTEQEYKTIFALQSGLDEKYPMDSTMAYWDRSGMSDFLKAREVAQKEVDAQISRWDDTAAPAFALSTTIAYNKAGDIISITNPNNKTTRFVTDALGNVLTVTDPAQKRVADNGYDYRNNPIMSVDVLGAETSWYYDPAGRVKQVTDPLGRSIKFTYDMDGLVTSSTTPKRNTTYIVHDDVGNPTHIFDPNGNEFRFFPIFTTRSTLIARND